MRDFDWGFVSGMGLGVANVLIWDSMLLSLPFWLISVVIFVKKKPG